MVTSASITAYEAPVVHLPEHTVSAASYIAWYVVALLVILALGVTLVAGMIAYCFSKGMAFSGQWHWTDSSMGYVTIGCQ
jgi:hypothetical protein